MRQHSNYLDYILTFSGLAQRARETHHCNLPLVACTIWLSTGWTRITSRHATQQMIRLFASGIAVQVLDFRLRH
jgi:hypothetical protein